MTFIFVPLFLFLFVVVVDSTLRGRERGKWAHCEHTLDPDTKWLNLQILLLCYELQIVFVRCKNFGSTSVSRIASCSLCKTTWNHVRQVHHHPGQSLCASMIVKQHSCFYQASALSISSLLSETSAQGEKK